MHTKLSTKDGKTKCEQVLCMFLQESVYRQAQATLPTLVVNKISHVCTFCLYGLKIVNVAFI